MTNKRRWTPQEDKLLQEEFQKQLINPTGKGNTINWSEVAKKLSRRSNKDCRKRYLNEMAGTLKKGPWSREEDDKLRKLVEEHGLSWVAVSQSMATRSADQCSKRWHHSLNPELDRQPWREHENQKLLRASATHGSSWKDVQEKHFPARSANNVKNQYTILMRRGVRLTEDVPPCCPLRTERPVGSSSSSSVHTPAATRSSSLSSPRISHPSPAPVSSLMQPPATQDAAELTVAAWGDSASGDRGDGAMDIDMFVPSFWDDPENNGYFLASPMDAVGGVYDGQFGMKYSEQCTTPIPGSMGSAEYQDVCSPPSAAGFSSVVSGGDDDRHGKDGHPVGSYDGDNGLGWPLDPLLIPDMSRSRSDSNISNGAAGSARTQQQPARHGSISAGSALSAHARTGTPTPSLASVAAGGFGLGSRTSRPSINTEVHASHYQQPSSSVSAGAGSGANSPRSRMTIVVDEAKPETLVEVMKVLMESQARVEFRRG